MRSLIIAFAVILLLSPLCPAQDPLPVVSSGWQRSVQKIERPAEAATGPAAEFIPENKNFQRNARESKMNSIDPNRDTIDGRRAAIDKAVQDSRTPNANDIDGYTYRATVRNDGPRAVKIVFWEYRFKELANPANVTHRQFLCSVNIKPGDSKELSVFTTLGPSDTIAAGSLAQPDQKTFDEKVLVNRIEFADGTAVQRGNWKLDDVKRSVDHVTSKPWGKETCRAF